MRAEKRVTMHPDKITANEKGLANCGNSVPSRPASVADFLFVAQIKICCSIDFRQAGTKAEQ